MLGELKVRHNGKTRGGGSSKKKIKKLKDSRHIGLGRKMKNGQRYQGSKYTE